MDDTTITPLARWMRSNKLRDQWLADQLGLSQPQVCRIRRGQTGTSPERAFQIERLTKGKVKASDVLLFRANDTTPCAEAA
ncbi:MAG: YdaS family helix-turn-helix protein [Brevundimonas sp.]|jgi:AraC-like DNA-binding protein